MPATSKELRSVSFPIRFRPSEREELERRAAELGMDASDLLRLGWRYFPRPKVER